MTALNYLARAIKNPKFILSENFILHPFASLSTVKRIIQSNDSMIQSAQKLTGERFDILNKYYSEISN
ncbi:MAG: hypothetical protein KGL95_09785, partial [Patescibacteria group bacterium]|nr:hypothetical protein [Patescibacteria group bacterium]